MHNENWDDIRFVLSVVETGSVLQASKQLGVNHATVLRRISAFEARHGSAIFARTAQGYRLLPDQVAVIKAAQQAQAAMVELGRLASGGQVTLRGTIRIASTDTLTSLILPEFVKTVQREAPDLSIALLSGNAHLDLLREQAILVVRPAQDLSEDLVGNAVAELGFAAYAADPAEERWFRLVGPLARSVPARWMEETLEEAAYTTASDSFLTLRGLAMAGQGIAILPCFVGDVAPQLQRLTDRLPKMRVPVWVARHIDAPESAPLRAVQALLEAYLSRRSGDLLGD